MEGGKLGNSPSRLGGDHSQSQDSDCRSGGRDALDVVSAGFAKGLETGRKASQGFWVPCTEPERSRAGALGSNPAVSHRQ